MAYKLNLLKTEAFASVFYWEGEASAELYLRKILRHAGASHVRATFHGLPGIPARLILRWILCV